MTQTPPDPRLKETLAEKVARLKRLYGKPAGPRAANDNEPVRPEMWWQRD